MKRILIIEDDPAISRGLQDSFVQEHYEVIAADDGEVGYQKAKKENIDLIILDLMLPTKNGMDVCRDLRADGISTPILMLTSKKDEMDKVLGLEIGADDYVTKPFSIRELQARIKALLRRKTEIVNEVEVFSFGKIDLDFKKYEAKRSGANVKLSSMEFDIIKYFIQHEGEVISRNQMLDDVWGYDSYPTTRTVDNYILSLRKKLENNPSAPNHFLTVHTTGYKFVK